MRFADAGIESADIDARVLLCAAVGIDHPALIREPDILLEERQAIRLCGFETRRLAREPVSRILGQREFWGLPFAVSPAVLDPRPETEGLVASVLDAVGGRRGDRLDILDLGVGSGAILGALLRELPRARGIGIDLSPDACQVARANLRSLGLTDRASLICGDWAAALATRFDIVVSNPPYVATGDLAGLDPEVRAHDPLPALDGGPDGLAAFRSLSPHLPSLLRSGGVAAFECGMGQGADIAELMRNAGMGGPSVYHDLAGHDRVVIGVAPP